MDSKILEIIKTIISIKVRFYTNQGIKKAGNFQIMEAIGSYEVDDANLR